MVLFMTFWLFFSILKHVPVYFSRLGECCIVVLLRSSTLMLGTGQLSTGSRMRLEWLEYIFSRMHPVVTCYVHSLRFPYFPRNPVIIAKLLDPPRSYLLHHLLCKCTTCWELCPWHFGVKCAWECAPLSVKWDVLAELFSADDSSWRRYRNSQQCPLGRPRGPGQFVLSW